MWTYAQLGRRHLYLRKSVRYQHIDALFTKEIDWRLIKTHPVHALFSADFCGREWACSSADVGQLEQPGRHGRSPDGSPGEPRHHGREIVSPVEAVFELGEVAQHVLLIDCPVGSSNGGFDIAGRRVDHGSAGADLDDLMGTSGVGDSTETSQAIADDLQVRLRLRLAKFEREWLQKLATRRSFRRTGLPSGAVSTAATNDVLPGAPRPRLPPERSPPR
jgi:hypothetical protein